MKRIHYLTLLFLTGLGLIICLSILSSPALAQEERDIYLPRHATAIYGRWLRGTQGTARDITFRGIGKGYDIADGVYPGWCIEYNILGDTVGAQLYSSFDDTMPYDVRILPWGQINYLLNHKRGSINDIQTAIWMIAEGPHRDFTITTAVRRMVDEARANADFVPGPGQFMAVIVYSDGLNAGRRSIQEMIIEVRISWPTKPSLTPDTPVPVITPHTPEPVVTPDTPTPVVTPILTPTATLTPTVGLVPPSPSLFRRSYVGLMGLGLGGWFWLLALPCLGLILLTLLAFWLWSALFGSRILQILRRDDSNISVTNIDSTDVQMKQVNSQSEAMLQTLEALRETINQAQLKIEQLGQRCLEYLQLFEYQQEYIREVQIKHIELKSAISNCLQDIQILEEIKQQWLQFYLERQAYYKRCQKPFVEEQDFQRYELKINELLALLADWKNNLNENHSKLILLANRIDKRQTTYATLRRYEVEIERLYARLHTYQERIDSGEISEQGDLYERTISSIKGIEAQILSLTEALDQLVISQEDCYQIESQLDQFIELMDIYSQEFGYIRQQYTKFDTVLDQLKWQSSYFSLDDAESVSIGLSERAGKLTIAPLAGQADKTTLTSGDHDPVINWEVVSRGEAATARWFIILKVRNPHVDVTIRSLRIDLKVSYNSSEVAVQNSISLNQQLPINFGEVKYTQQWQTKELEILGITGQNHSFMMCVIATWSTVFVESKTTIQ
ncbi:MAG: hypothetical protein AAF629_10535 [Chloroflexota bacterium]